MSLGSPCIKAGSETPYWLSIDLNFPWISVFGTHWSVVLYRLFVGQRCTLIPLGRTNSFGWEKLSCFTLQQPWLITRVFGGTLWCVDIFSLTTEKRTTRFILLTHLVYIFKVQAHWSVWSHAYMQKHWMYNPFRIHIHDTSILLSKSFLILLVWKASLVFILCLWMSLIPLKIERWYTVCNCVSLYSRYLPGLLPQVSSDSTHLVVGWDVMNQTTWNCSNQWVCKQASFFLVTRSLECVSKL